MGERRLANAWTRAARGETGYAAPVTGGGGFDVGAETRAAMDFIGRVAAEGLGGGLVFHDVTRLASAPEVIVRGVAWLVAVGNLSEAHARDVLACLAQFQPGLGESVSFPAVEAPPEGALGADGRVADAEAGIAWLKRVGGAQWDAFGDAYERLAVRDRLLESHLVTWRACLEAARRALGEAGA